MGCRDFFSSNSENKERGYLLQTESEATQIDWELSSASKHSPGPVEDAEDLIRYWISPFHFNTATGQLKPTAFEDASDKGLSVNRSKFTTPEAVQAMAVDRVDEWNKNNPTREQRTLLGYSTFTAGEVRSVMTDGSPPRRALGVFDTAKPDDASHADVCQLVKSNQGGRSARTLLREVALASYKSFT